MTKATDKLVTPSDLSESLGVDAKLIRGFLRREFTRDASRKNTSWHLTSEMCDAVRNHFTPKDSDDSDAESVVESGE